MTDAEPKIRIETREELIYMLAEAAAIEHNVMCCYLYAAWSLKRGERDGLSAEQARAVEGWRRAVTAVAIEEMGHLVLACNLATAVGAGPHLSRPNFPIRAGYHPAGIVMELARFSPAVLDHFIFLEHPEGVDARDSSEFVHPTEYHRVQRKGRLMPSDQDYGSIGHLYRGIRHGFEVLSHHLGEEDLFCTETASQIGPADAGLPGLMVVSDLASAIEAIETIIEQGEGAPEHSEDSHYNRFLRVREEYRKFLEADPSFEPSFPVAHNPTMRPPTDPRNRVHVIAAEAARVLDLANSLYGHVLRCLVQSYGRGAGEEEGKRLFVDVAIELMELLTPIGSYLASLPANPHHPGVNAGVTFTMLRDIARIPVGPGEKRMMAERVAEIAQHARLLFPPGHELASTADRLDKTAASFGISQLRIVGHTGSQPRPTPKPRPDDLPSGGDDVQLAKGRDITVRFHGKRCIHARFCVLGGRNVFKANTAGEWIFPDAEPVEAVVRIAYNCPSGAIQYERSDGGPAEAAPQVNLVNLRENGPYAFRAPLTVAGVEVGYRATLCRCGASKRKPFCDGSHKELPFRATGEPDTRDSRPLASRDGLLDVSPEPNGPLVVTGNLEICTGTGRTIDRVTKVRLCRCGGSRNKPFCDNTHLKIGFEAP